MKKHLLTIVLIAIPILFFTTCVENNNKETKRNVEKEKISNENFDWLLGNWKRNNEEYGKETFEIWTKKNHSTYYGIGFTMHKKDTLNQEKIRLIKTDGKWILKVQTQDDPNPTIFNMTSYGDQEFICENKTLDFPKLIKYWKNENKINAIVSGDDLEIRFEFEKIIE
jgi:hypothetical protein